MTGPRIVWRDIDQIPPHPDNAKAHDHTFLRDSFRRYGFRAPVAVSTSGLTSEGHGRIETLKAMRDNGEEPPEGIRLKAKRWEVPAIEGLPAFESEELEREFLVASNRAVELGGWDDGRIEALLREFPAIEPVGFAGPDLKALLGRLAPAEVVEDEVPEPPKTPVTKPGDVWTMGDHRLACGDCRTASAGLFGDATAQLAYTDPPWGVDYSGGTKERERLTGDTDTGLYLVACELARDHCDVNSALYLWHAGVKGIAAAAAAAAAGWEIRCQIIWNKNIAQFGALTAQYKAKHEPAYYCHKKGKAPRWYGPTNEVTVWDFPRASANEYHPTQKPVEMAGRAIGNSSAAGDLVADFFMGSGSTLVAAEQFERRCYGVELDPAYCDVIIERWQNLTGGKATRKAAS